MRGVGRFVVENMVVIVVVEIVVEMVVIREVVDGGWC